MDIGTISLLIVFAMGGMLLGSASSIFEASPMPGRERAWTALRHRLPHHRRQGRLKVVGFNDDGRFPTSSPA